MAEKEDVYNQTSSELPGFKGVTERFLRKFRTISFLLGLMPLGLIYLICIGLSVLPGVMIYQYFDSISSDLHFVFRSLSLAFSIALAYVSYILAVVIVVPLVNFLLPFRLRSVRGNWYSLHTIPWFYHNALVQLVRYTVLDLVTPSPINTFFFKMMGMKMGKGCVINTSNISDPALIELGDYVTIGGSATLFAHYGMGGYLIIDKLKIGDNSTIGLKASLMGNVEIGKNCVVGPHVILLPKSRLADGEKISVDQSTQKEKREA
ncbi:MAG: hypothetical protein AB8E15_09735 [Bdellovibrionales bacterium]